VQGLSREPGRADRAVHRGGCRPQTSRLADGSGKPPRSRTPRKPNSAWRPGKPQRMSADQISAIVEGLGGLLALLRDANPRDPSRDLRAGRPAHDLPTGYRDDHGRGRIHRPPTADSSGTSRPAAGAPLSPLAVRSTPEVPSAGRSAASDAAPPPF